MAKNTRYFGFRISDCGFRKWTPEAELVPGPQSAIRNPQSAIPPRPAFTLTELLVVIAIIAILAGLAATAAVSAMKAARRASISLELKQLAGSMDNFKNEYGAYPPNGMNPNNAPSTGPVAVMLQADFEGMFKNAFPNHRENPQLIRALCGQSNDSNFPNLQNGMTAAEALYFWLGGFSDDERYPISGPRGPSFLVVNGDPSDEVVEDRKRPYAFELTRLQPVAASGVFDESKGRFLVYPDPKNPNQRRRINFWRYHAKGSEQPFVYFDVSRHKPGPFTMKGRYDCWAVNPDTGTAAIFALKQLRRGVSAVNNNFNNMLFVDQGKCQILHCGLDDDWGADLAHTGCITTPGNGPKNANDVMLFPDGPFLREAADTLTNFTDGTLADAQEASK